MQRGFLIFLPSRLVPRLVCPQNLRNISLVAQIAAFEALPNSFHCRSTFCRICSTMAGSTDGGGTAGAAPCPQQASTAQVRKTALRRPCRLRSRKAGGGWSFRNLLRRNKTNKTVTPACPSAPQPQWTGKCNAPTTYDRTGGERHESIELQNSRGFSVRHAAGTQTQPAAADGGIHRNYASEQQAKRRDNRQRGGCCCSPCIRAVQYR